MVETPGQVARKRAQYQELAAALGAKLGHPSFQLHSQFHHVIWMGDFNYHIGGAPADPEVLATLRGLAPPPAVALPPPSTGQQQQQQLEVEAGAAVQPSGGAPGDEEEEVVEEGGVLSSGGPAAEAAAAAAAALTPEQCKAAIAAGRAWELLGGCDELTHEIAVGATTAL
jgi:hypothetical protein|eukprot:COSAG01_NODE_293_length_19376_cov_41.772060_14_plen_170_part_00